MSSRRSGLLKVNLIDLNLPINEFINIDHHTQAINIHEHKARIHIVSDAAVCTSSRTWVYHDPSLMLVGSELVGVTRHKDINVQLPLEHG